MHGQARREAPTHNRRPRPKGVGSRPDRVALWAVFMAVIAMVAAAASGSAEGASGGLSDSETRNAPAQCEKERFGKRRLRHGDCGRDVRTLNWILNSYRFADANPRGKRFERRTHRTVRRFQHKVDMRTHGVVNRRTMRRMVRTMRSGLATWYGPGFYGNTTACGHTLTRRTVGVAHRRLPCGTRVTIKYKGRFLRTRVIDRGPYAHGADWDLTNGAAKRLGFSSTDEIRVAAIR